MRQLLLASSILAGLHGVAAAPAAAQTSDDAAESAQDVIIVTANRREQNLQDVPGQITAISGEDLEKQGFGEVSELLEVIPGASVVSRTAAGFETVQLRGIASGTVGDATVGYYIDNVSFSVPNLQLVPPSRLFDLKRVEVLRGPQGTLYGQGAMGGAIRLITNDPSSTEYEARARGEVSFTEGGGTNYAVDAIVNIPLVEDQLGFRVTGGYERLSGFADEIVAGPGGLGFGLGEEDANDVNSYNIRGQLKWTPTDNVAVTLSGWRIENSTDFSNNLLPDANPLLPATQFAAALAEPALGVNLGTPGGVDPFIDTRLTLGSAFIEWELPFATLESASSYTAHTLDLVSSGAQDTGVSVPPALGGPLPPGTFFSPFVNTSLFETTAFTQEVRLISNEEAPFEWIIGGFFNDATITSNFNVNVFDAIALQAVDADLETTSFAFFGEISKSFLDDRLTPLFGIRYFRDDRGSSGGATAFLDLSTVPPTDLAALFPPLTPENSNQVFDAVSPRFSIAFAATDSLNLYASATRGFRSGGIQTPGQVLTAQLDGVTTSDVIIDADSLWTYEGGMKGVIDGFLGGSLAFDTAFYYTVWSDIQVPFTSSSGFAVTANAGDARIWGVDAGVIWRTPLDGLTIDASGNYNDTEFTEIDAGVAGALAGVELNGALPNVPNSNFTVGLDYAQPIAADIEGFIRGRYSFRARQFSAGAGPLFGASDNLDQLSFRAGVAFGGVSVEGFVENALNDLGPAVGVSTLATPFVQPLYPRRIGFAITGEF